MKRHYTYREFKISLPDKAESIGKTVPVIGETNDTLIIAIPRDTDLKTSTIVRPVRTK